MCDLPLLAITLGDPAGTGPELLTKALALPEVGDDFAKTASEFDTMQELRDDLREKIRGQLA